VPTRQTEVNEEKGRNSTLVSVAKSAYWILSGDTPGFPGGINNAHLPSAAPGGGHPPNLNLGSNLGPINPLQAGAGAVGNGLAFDNNNYYKKAVVGLTVLAGGYALYWTFSDTAPVKSVVDTFSSGLNYASESLWGVSTSAPAEVAQQERPGPGGPPKSFPEALPAEKKLDAQALQMASARSNTWHVAYFMDGTDGTRPAPGTCPVDGDTAAAGGNTASSREAAADAPVRSGSESNQNIRSDSAAPPQPSEQPPQPPAQPLQPVEEPPPPPGPPAEAGLNANAGQEGNPGVKPPPGPDPGPGAETSSNADGKREPVPVVDYVEKSEESLTEPTEPTELTEPAEITEPAESETPVPDDAESTPLAAPEEPPTVKERVVHPLAGAYNSNAWAANTMFQLELSDRINSYLHDETRPDQTSAWIQYSGSRIRLHGGGDDGRTQGDKSTVLMGFDLLAHPSGSRGQLTAGVMGGYGHFQGDTRVPQWGEPISGKLDGHGAGLYGTYQNDVVAQEGFYVDSWVLWNQFKNRVHGGDVSAESYRSKGMTASVELGSRIPLAERNRVTYVLQPHVQSIYQHVRSNPFTQSDGARVEFLNGARFQTAFGLRAAAHIPTGSTAVITPYVSARWLHTTRGYGVRIDGVTTRMDSGRNLAQLKLGIQGEVSSRLTLNANLFHNTGNQGMRQTGGNLMMNYRY
jgi:outer membrane autotransporter protein